MVMLRFHCLWSETSRRICAKWLYRSQYRFWSPSQPRTLNAMGKDSISHPIHEAVQRIHDQGIGIMGTFIVGSMMMTPGSFKGLLISAWIRNSTGPSPYYGALSWDRFIFRLEKEEDFLQGLEKYDSLNVGLPALKDVCRRIRKRDEKNLKEVFSTSSIYKRILKTLDSSLFYLAMNWQFHKLTRKW